jgi:hypothetical protein
VLLLLRRVVISRALRVKPIAPFFRKDPSLITYYQFISNINTMITLVKKRVWRRSRATPSLKLMLSGCLLIVMLPTSILAFHTPDQSYLNNARSNDAFGERRQYSPLYSSDGVTTRQRLRGKLQMTNDNNDLLPTSLKTLRTSNDANLRQPKLELQIQLETLTRILLPSLASSLLSFLLFPSLAVYLSYLINDSATFAVLSVDSSQFIQNFLTVTGLTFSILVGQTYYFMYQQQEAVFVSLFGEVTEAKSLLEQVALVCQGRRDMYEMCLGAIKR